jgi:6-phosphogluconolactonase
MRPVSVDFIVEPDHAAASRRAAELIVDAVRTGRSLGLSGGSTPRLAYELAAELEPDWSRATVWLGDDRCVPHDDERSNVRLVRETVLTRLFAEPRFFADEEGLEAEEAAWRLDALLRAEGLPAFQLLGLGPDGHTASLFPNAAALDETDRLAVATAAGMEPFVDRVTMTIPALAGAAQVVFLVTGDAKADMARAAFASEPSRAIPASLVRSASGTTTVILDEAAAGRL